MLGLRVALPMLLAQQDGAGAGGTMLPLFILGAVAIFYFVMLRPQQRQQEQKRRALIDGLKKNDKVVTTGGIYGTVTAVDPAADRVVLRIDDERGVKVTFSRGSVARVVETSGEKPSESA